MRCLMTQGQDLQVLRLKPQQQRNCENCCSTLPERRAPQGPLEVLFHVGPREPSCCTLELGLSCSCGCIMSLPAAASCQLAWLEEPALAAALCAPAHKPYKPCHASCRPSPFTSLQITHAVNCITSKARLALVCSEPAYAIVTHTRAAKQD